MWSAAETMIFGKARFAEAYYKPHVDDNNIEAERLADIIPTAPPESGLHTRAPLPPHHEPGALPPELPPPVQQGYRRAGALLTMMMSAKNKVCGSGAGGRRRDIESDDAGLLTGKKKHWVIGSSALMCAGLLLAWSLSAATVVVVSHPGRRVKVAEVALDVDPDSGKVGSEGVQAILGLAMQGEPRLKVKLGGGLGSSGGGRRLLQEEEGGGGAESLRVDLLERVSALEPKPRAGLAALKNWSTHTDPTTEAKADPQSTTTTPSFPADESVTTKTSTQLGLDVVRVENLDGELFGHILCEEEPSGDDRTLEASGCTMIPEEEQALGALFYNRTLFANTSTQNGSNISSGSSGAGRGGLSRRLQEALAGFTGNARNATPTGGTVVNISIKNFLRARSGTWEDGDDAETEVPPNEEEDWEEEAPLLPGADGVKEGLSFEVKPGDAVLAHFRTANGGAKSKEPALASVVSVETAEGEKGGEELLAVRLELSGESEAAAGGAPLQTVPKAWVVPLEDPADVGEQENEDGELAARPRRACAIGCRWIPEAKCWQKDECSGNSWIFIWHLYRTASKAKREWLWRYLRGETTCKSGFYTGYGLGYGSCGGSGDIEDALQHSMYTAILAAQAKSGSDALKFMDGRERDPKRSRPSMISAADFQAQKCGESEDLHAIMDKHNNEEGRRVAERLKTQACAFHKCVWRWCVCIWRRTVWPSANRIGDELVSMFNDAKLITSSTTKTTPDGRLWYLKNSCGPGCGHGSCSNSCGSGCGHCVCNSGWTGIQCGHNRRRRRRSSWR